MAELDPNVQYDLITSYLGGINAPVGLPDVGKWARVDASGKNLEYVSFANAAPLASGSAAGAMSTENYTLLTSGVVKRDGTLAMQGTFDVGGYPLKNFVTAESLTILLAAATPTDIIESNCGLTSGQMVRVGVRISYAQTVDNSVKGYADIVLTLKRIGSTYTIVGTPDWDVSGLPAGVTCQALATASGFRVVLTSSLQARAKARLWYQFPEALDV